jgi:ABC-type lipoprotein export system ATPase subunit
LDQASGRLVIDHLTAVAQEGTTVVIITHDAGVAARFDRQIALLDGRVVSDSTQPQVGGHG